MNRQMTVTVQCKDPKGCLLCIKACQAHVLVLKPIGAEIMGPRVEGWEVRAIFKDFCSGCQRCVEACPKGRVKL